LNYFYDNNDGLEPQTGDEIAAGADFDGVGWAA